MRFKSLLILLVGVIFMNKLYGQDSAHVTYLGNAGLMVDYEQVEVLFDPFFHNHYGQYQLVPEHLRQAIFNNQKPFDSIEMILVSHAHADHFDPKDIADYLLAHTKTQLMAPLQAVDMLKKDQRYQQFSAQVLAIELAYGDKPLEYKFNDLDVQVVRIPHAGWPGRAELSNLVYRVTLKGKLTVMHMGDADTNDVHYKPWKTYWEQQLTDTAFPPYWFMLDPKGQKVLSERINATHAIGVHVPVKVPDQLRQSGAEFFSETGQTTTILISNKQGEH